MLSYSNYIASVDGGACVACGVCEGRCPMGAIVVEGDVACVDASKCLGCGACTATCDAESVRLVLRGEVSSPPPIMAFLEARMK